MSAKPVFVDTNVLVYAFDRDAGEKHERAKALLVELWRQSVPPSISVQVLQELYVTLTRLGVASEQAQAIADDYLAWMVIPGDTELFRAAVEEHRRWKLSFWDGAIIAAARRSGARELLTEDLSDGQDYGGLRARNPLVG